MDEWRLHVIAKLAELGPNLGPLVYMVCLSFYVTACLPAEPIDFLPGFLFGWIKGSLVSIFGKLLGLALSMLLGRYLFRARIRSFVFERFPITRRITFAVEKEGFWALVLVRGLALPAALKNYGLSACLDVSLAQNLLASAFILVPHSLVWAWIGDSAATVSTNFADLNSTTLLKSVVPNPMIMIFLVLPIAIFMMAIVRNVAKRVNFKDDEMIKTE